MKHQNDELDYQLYVMAEISYTKMCEAEGIEEDEMYPPDWFGMKDYHAKVEMLAEAIQKEEPVGETTRYREHLIGAIRDIEAQIESKRKQKDEQ